MSKKDKAARQRKRGKQAKAKAWKRRAAGSGSAPAAARAPSSLPRGMTENRQFNRLESTLLHIYYDTYGFRGVGEVEYDGWVKCRLLHGHGYSLIVADQIYVEDEDKGLRWIQPLAFAPNLLTKLSDTEVVCVLHVDISCGHTLQVQFLNHDHVADMPDGSQLFRCRVKGIAALPSFATGEAQWHSSGRPYLRLYHHTTSSAAPLILNSRHFRTSPWNIQGSSKQLKNVAYAYFTPIDTLRTDEDLKRIGMSTEGTVELRRDGFTPPTLLEPNYLESFKRDILQLPVYRCDPAKRDGRVEVWIDAAVLAPQHIYRHEEGGSVYYELPHPFIQRVGTEPGQTLAFDHERRIHHQSSLKHFDYAVVGDCTTLDGLHAPYDEENTSNILKVERLPPGTTMLAFWFDRANTDLFSTKKVDLQQFSPPRGPATLP